MFFHIGTPGRLSDLGVTLPDFPELKRRVDIAIIDDESFIRTAALRNHGFRLVELGGDIKSVDQVAAYPIIVCDVKGVGRSFESRFEGAHVVGEIRKAYPDKFLISYTGMTYDASYNDKLALADAVIPKDAAVEVWTQVLERGLGSAGDPTQRWMRFRSHLLSRGIDLFDEPPRKSWRL